jgi:WD40 repeat protein
MVTRPTGIRILDAATGKHQDWDDPRLTNVRSFTWLPDGTEIAVAVPDASGTLTIRIYSVAGRKVVRTIPVHGAPVSQNAWSPDGRNVLILPEGHAKPQIRVAEVATGRIVGALPSAGAAYFVTADQILVVYNGTAKLYDLSGKLLQQTTLPSKFAGRQISVGRP